MKEENILEQIIEEIKTKIINIDSSGRSIERIAKEFGVPDSVAGARVLEFELEDLIIKLELPELLNNPITETNLN